MTGTQYKLLDSAQLTQALLASDESFDSRKRLQGIICPVCKAVDSVTAYLILPDPKAEHGDPMQCGRCERLYQMNLDDIDFNELL